MARIYDIVIKDAGEPYIVVNLRPRLGGPTDEASAIAFAQAEARSIGWSHPRVTRVAKTPLGGFSISVSRS